MQQENSAATALRVVYAVIASILIIIFASNLAMWATIMNKHFWRDFFTSGEVSELAVEELDLSIEDSLRAANPNIDIDFDDDEVTQEFVNLVLEDYINVAIEGEDGIDEDRYREFFEDHEEEFFGDMDLSRSEIRELEDDAVDGIAEKYDQLADEFRESDSYEFLEGFNDFTDANFTCMCVTGLIIFAGFVVLMLIHKNKFLPVRALGISMTVAQGINVLIWGGILALVNVAINEASTDDAIVELMISKINGYSLGIIFGMFAGLALGIVLIVVGVSGTKNYNKTLDTYDNPEQPDWN